MKLPPPPKIEAKSVQSMFEGIARRYDIANRSLSLGIDNYWRSVLTSLVSQKKPTRVLDLATGSGDVAFALRKKLPESTEIIGLDFCEGLLDIAKQRAQKKNTAIPFLKGDCLSLPFENSYTDATTISFGFRNFEDRAQGLREMLRVLKPSGWAFILEFSQPSKWIRAPYYFYLQKILPSIASLITRDKQAYEYLASSIAHFPSKELLKNQILDAGFESASYRSLSLGIVAIHCAQKAAF